MLADLENQMDIVLGDDVEGRLAVRTARCNTGAGGDQQDEGGDKAEGRNAHGGITPQGSRQGLSPSRPRAKTKPWGGAASRRFGIETRRAIL